jgi:hypothetical protein
MGLDLTVIAKPKAGFEAEARDLLVTLAVGYGVMDDPAPARPGLLDRILPGRSAASKRRRLAETQARFEAITTPGYASVGAPVVGQDQAADDWVRSGVADGTINQFGPDPNAAIAGLAGLYVLPLAPPCDGLPVYSNAGIGTIDETSFRGAFVDFCVDILDEKDRLAVWGVMESSTLHEYGKRLMVIADAFAERHDLRLVLASREVTWSEQGSPEAQLHITATLARWAIFWGSRGFGSYPDF